MTAGVDGLAGSALWPDSVALIGASDDPGKTTSRPLRYLRAAGYTGRIYPVNPRRDTVDGNRCWPSVVELPEVPQHVYVLTGTEHVISLVGECARLGVPVATVLASGFAEEGAEGRQREQQLREAAGAMRIVGPSSLGVINPRNGLLLTANAAFAEPDLGSGRIFVASQSGSVIGALLSRGKERGIAFAGLVSTGGEVNLGLGEICLSTVDDDGIGSYALFMESLEHTDELAEFAAAAATRGKPIVVYKLGRSAQGAELSLSHTGALAGSDDEADAFFTAHSIRRVDHLEALIETPALLEKLPEPPSERELSVAVLTTTGGGAALVVDQLGVRGIRAGRPSAEVLRQLHEAGAPVTDNTVLDLTLAGATHEVVRGSIDILQRSGEFDVVIMVIGSSARFHPELAVRAVAECADGPRPVAAFTLPDAQNALAALGAAGVPAFRTPESIADAVAAAGSGGAPRPASRARAPAGCDRVVFDELDSYGVLGKLDIPTQLHVAQPIERALAGELPEPLRFPVAVKALSAALTHKSDAGGVALGVSDSAGLAAASERVSGADASMDRLLLTEMAADGVDALVGYRTTDAVGPLIVLAAGGITAQLYRDRSLRLAPVDLPTAHQMISEVRGLAAVRGFRGQHGDVDALAQAIVALSNIGDTDPSVVEAEINPLRVFPPGSGVAALDALVCVRR